MKGIVMAQNDTNPTVHQFIERLGLKMTASPLAKRSGPTDDWHKFASHWECVITNPRGYTMRVEYSMGSAHRRWKPKHGIEAYGLSEHDRKRFQYKPGGPVPYLLLSQKTIWSEEVIARHTEPVAPTLADVLDCLASDASGFDAADCFATWAAEYGYSDDSIKARDTYEACGAEAKRLRALLGEEYETLLYKTERL
jgi:hypothetical protein